ncbi:uncharacterized protein LOC114155426 [Xiphophorus couchianus]|uniref:uncharacterized protein LOC114155426 n=1 Tax=Xiphophorus couchianus TaxID=32473 RepID=UPI001015D953|nr:uncharacterized protein LOC114155426 [Xiphophorus couchianus]
MFETKTGVAFLSSLYSKHFTDCLASGFLNKEMTFGLYLSIILLSLITFGQLAIGNVLRYASRNLGPSTQAETLHRSYRPVPSSYEGSLLRRGSVFSSNFLGDLSTEVSKPWGSVPSPGQSGYGRQVNSYSQPGSVSSYRSASALTRQQQPQGGLLLRAPGMREPSSQGERRYGSSVVSSGAIEIHAPPQLQPSSPGTDVQLTPESASQPSIQHPAFSAPAVLQNKAGMWDTVKFPSAKGPQPASRPTNQHPAFSAPAVLQTKTGMWHTISLPKTESTARRHQHSLSVPAMLKTNPGQLGIYTSSVRAPESTAQRHQKALAFSAPAVLQTNNLWGSRPSADSNQRVGTNVRSSRPVSPGYHPRGLQSGCHATQQQARLLGSLFSYVPKNKDLLQDASENPQMKPGSRTSRPVNVASPYQCGS